MRFEQSQLFFTALYAIAVGIVLGIIYDVFRIQRISMSRDYHFVNIRKRENNSKTLNLLTNFLLSDTLKSVIIFIEDVAFFVLSAIIVIIFIYQSNSGIIRWFEMSGAVIGFALYYFTVGRLVVSLSEYIIFAVRWVIGTVFKYTLLPIATLIYKLLSIAFRAVKLRGDMIYTSVYIRRSIARVKKGKIFGYRYGEMGSTDKKYDEKAA